MAQLLAPYNNSMRLGQGFNSYTQQICLDRAVSIDPEWQPGPARGKVTLGQGGRSNGQIAEGGNADQLITGISSTEFGATDADGETTSIEVPSWVKPQIITYSARFVEKISDVTDAMNISGSLSIKTSVVGGKGSGSYVDSDKFKSSDINFHLQVRVTNQIHDAINYTEFNEIESIEKSKFTEVYGDTFISGWEEGGELDAILSIKVLDKSKIFEIKASLEAELNTPAIGGKVEGAFEMTKNNLSRDTETTVTVNWSGGGSIKDPREDWTINSLKKAAAAFPELVAITPQRTFAILTKYTALADFQKKQRNFTPLDYENAGIYTSALLDSYMDYKALWKQISNATYELEANRATIDMAEPDEDLAALAKTEETSSKTEGSPTTKQLSVFAPSFAGLIDARNVCRFEMAKIVKEVDEVAKDPSLAIDPHRDARFLHPLIFKLLLPLVRSLSPENAVLGVRDPKATLLLGYSQPKVDRQNLPQIHQVAGHIKDYDVRLRNLIDEVAFRAHDYRMMGCIGPYLGEYVPKPATPFNDLVKMDQTYRPQKISIWMGTGKLSGIEIKYAGGQIKSHGSTSETASHSLSMNESQIIVEMMAKEVVEITGLSSITYLAFATSAGTTVEAVASKGIESQAEGDKKSDSSAGSTSKRPTDEASTPSKAEPKLKTTVWSQPDDLRYSLRGFFGLTVNTNLCSIGAVWGKNSFVPVLKTPIQTPLCKSILGLSEELQINIKNHVKASAGTFYLSAYISAPEDKVISTPSSSASSTPKSTPKFFNALDFINPQWRIQGIGFASDAQGHLCGLRVRYHNGQERTHGAYNQKTDEWFCEIKSELAIVKMTAGRVGKDSKGFIDTVEFIRGEAAKDGRLPTWPLEVSTFRYLGKQGKTVDVDRRETVENHRSARAHQFGP